MTKTAFLALLAIFLASPSFAQEDDAWPKLTPIQKAAFTEALSALNPQKVIILCNDEESSCKDFASSLKASFKADGWDATKDNFQFGKLKDGITVWQKGSKNIAKMLSDSTGYEVKTTKNDILNEKTADVVITIGDKK